MSRPSFSAWTLALTALFAGGCQSADRPGVIVRPDRTLETVDWSVEELAKPIAVRPMHADAHASHHVVRIVTAEPPHYHDHSDLTVFVLRGRVRMNLADRQVLVRPGDVIVVPRSVLHWAENLDPTASEAYIIFTPPFDPADRRLAR